MSSSHTETRSYKCICGKSYKKERKFTKHQIKRGHGIYKKKVKSFPAKERKRKDLLGSILTGMKSQEDKTHQSEEWEGQLTLHDNQPVVYQNTSSHSTQKQDPKSKTRCSNSSLSPKKLLPIFEESQSSGSSKQRVSHKTPSLLNLQAKEKIKMRVSETTSKIRDPSTKKKIKHALFRQTQTSKKQQGTNTEEKKIKGKGLDSNANEKLFNNNGNKKDNRSRKDNSETSDLHRKFSKHMNGVKSMKSKSAWAESRRNERIGSMRTDWRPDRAYDIHRNSMDVNDTAHPNDDFDLCRITNKK